MYVNETTPPFHGLEDKSIKTFILFKGIYIFNMVPNESPIVFFQKNRTYPKIYTAFQGPQIIIMILKY